MKVEQGKMQIFANLVQKKHIYHVAWISFTTIDALPMYPNPENGCKNISILDLLSEKYNTINEYIKIEYTEYLSCLTNKVQIKL